MKYSFSIYVQLQKYHITINISFLLCNHLGNNHLIYFSMSTSLPVIGYYFYCGGALFI